MSRSFKKYPGFTDDGPKRKRFYKRYSNKIARKNWNLPLKGNGHKKNGLSYDIVDWKFIYFRESDYEHYSWRTGKLEVVPKNERYKMRMK